MSNNTPGGSSQQVQYTGNGTFAVASHTHTTASIGSNTSTWTLANVSTNPFPQDIFMEVYDEKGRTYRMSMLDLAKKLGIGPAPNDQPKRCYE